MFIKLLQIMENLTKPKIVIAQNENSLKMKKSASSHLVVMGYALS